MHTPWFAGKAKKWNEWLTCISYYAIFRELWFHNGEIQVWSWQSKCSSDYMDRVIFGKTLAMSYDGILFSRMLFLPRIWISHSCSMAPETISKYQGRTTVASRDSRCGSHCMILLVLSLIAAKCWRTVQTKQSFRWQISRISGWPDVDTTDLGLQTINSPLHSHN